MALVTRIVQPSMKYVHVMLQLCLTIRVMHTRHVTVGCLTIRVMHAQLASAVEKILSVCFCYHGSNQSPYLC